MNSVSTPEKYPDSEVIKKIVAGEVQLYEILIRRNNPYIYRTARSYGFGHHDAEDLMQETYISAYRNLAGFKNNSSFKTWITRIMLNHCYQKKQKSGFKNEVLYENVTDENNNPMFQKPNNTINKILTKELGNVMENALEQLPENYRMIFTMRELNGLSVSETAEVTNLSETNIKARLSRAKEMLRTEIEKMYSLTEIYEFNLIYCDKIVERVMSAITSENLEK